MSGYTDAIKEAYVLAAPNVVELDTLEVVNSVTAERLFLVRSYEDFPAKLETGESVVFQAFGFILSLPDQNERGVGDLVVEADNVEGVVERYLDEASAAGATVTFRFRPYLASDPDNPHLVPPLEMQLKQYSLRGSRVVCRASFCQVVNTKFPNEYYTRSDFPGLGN